MTDEWVRDREFTCVEDACDERMTVDDAERGRGVVITYESFLPSYLDVYAWCREHVPDRPDDDLKEAVKTGEIEWSPAMREERWS